MLARTFAHLFLLPIFLQEKNMNLFELQSAEFKRRHIGVDESETGEMLKTMGERNVEDLIDKTVPSSIRMNHELKLPEAMSEHEYLQHIKNISLKN